MLKKLNWIQTMESAFIPAYLGPVLQSEFNTPRICHRYLASLRNSRNQAQRSRDSGYQLLKINPGFLVHVYFAGGRRFRSYRKHVQAWQQLRIFMNEEMIIFNKYEEVKTQHPG